MVTTCSPTCRGANGAPNLAKKASSEPPAFYGAGAAGAGAAGAGALGHGIVADARAVTATYTRR